VPLESIRVGPSLMLHDVRTNVHHIGRYLATWAARSTLGVNACRVITNVA